MLILQEKIQVSAADTHLALLLCRTELYCHLLPRTVWAEMAASKISSFGRVISPWPAIWGKKGKMQSGKELLPFVLCNL